MVSFRKVDCDRDAAEITSIYNHYITGTDITFETEPLDTDGMAERIRGISAQFPFLVCDIDGHVAGFAYAHEWNSKPAYRRSVETTVYLSPEWLRRGLGSRMLATLEAECASRGFVALVALVTAGNTPSCRFHERMGYEKVGTLREIGRKFGRLLDVDIYQHILRSTAYLRPTPSIDIKTNTPDT